MGGKTIVLTVEMIIILSELWRPMEFWWDYDEFVGVSVLDRQDLYHRAGSQGYTDVTAVD
jgi:hypothetical protein